MWHYVKCFPCNGHSPFAPPTSSRRCSNNLHGQFPNSQPTISPPPFQGCRKMVQTISGFSQWLQSINCFFLAEKFSGSLFTSLTANSSIPGRRKLLSPFQDSQHTPPIILVQRLRFVVYWRCVLKTPPKSIFFLPSIPLSFQPLFRAGILRKIPGY